MSSVVNVVPSDQKRDSFSWMTLAWFGALVFVCYAPVIIALVKNWGMDDDMGHGYFVPAIAAYIAWQKKDVLLKLTPKANWWGLAIVFYGAFQLYLGTLGAELFLSRTAIVITMIGIVLFLGGAKFLKELAFPLCLLFLMVPIPSVVYNQITFPLQIRASELAEMALNILGVPVFREGNILNLPSQPLNVVEACSGIRSLLTLTFLSLVYGYFFEKQTWIRVVLFFSTIPIAITANAARVTLTGLLSEIKPEYAEGFFHEFSGWVIFMVALGIMVVFHQAITRGMGWYHARKQANVDSK
jgi:exosortase